MEKSLFSKDKDVDLLVMVRAKGREIRYKSTIFKVNKDNSKSPDTGNRKAKIIANTINTATNFIQTPAGNKAWEATKNIFSKMTGNSKNSGDDDDDD